MIEITSRSMVVTPGTRGILALALALPSGLASRQAQAQQLLTSPNMNSYLNEVNPLHVEVEPAIPDAEWFPSWIHNRNPELVEQFPDAPGHEQWVAIEIEGSTYDYKFRVIAIRDGRPVGVVPDMSLCECNNDGLLGAIDEDIAIAVERLESSRSSGERNEAKAGSKPAFQESTVLKPEGHDVPRPKNDHRRRLGPQGYSGIGLGVLGVGGLAAGTSLTIRPATGVRGNPGIIEERSTRAPGVGIAVVSGIFLAVGIPLLVTDLVKRRRRSTAVRPVIGPQFLGISVKLRALSSERWQ